MTHIELLNLLNKNKHLINQAYSDGLIDNINDELFESTLFTKTLKGYKLNKSYINFVNTILDRVDYSIVFGDYEKEHSELIKDKIKYQETKNSYYKENIIKRIDDIFYKFLNRDRQIKALLDRLENEISVEIDIIIEEAHNILTQIIEMIEANKKISKTFRELKTLDIEFKKVIMSIDEELYKFIKNIDNYIDVLNRFIIQTKNKRRQNRLFSKVANDILNEEDNYLTQYLKINIDKSYHTIKFKYKKIPLFVDDNDKRLKKLIKELDLTKAPKKLANTHIQTPAPEKLNLIDLDEILESLKEGSNDLFEFLLKTLEFDDAFKIYLQLLDYKNIEFSNEFNQYNIRIIKWII